MKLTSPVFEEGQSIPRQYTCQGEDVNPPLAIVGVPPSAQSLVLILDDPDAPSGTWTHWTVWNIDPATITIAEHSVPAGANEGTTSAKSVGYHGPCPPDREHRYVFTLSALDTRLKLPESTTVDTLRHAMDGHLLGETTLTGQYVKR